MDIDVFLRRRVPGCLDSICQVENEILDGLRQACSGIADDILFDLKVIINELMINAVRYGCREESMKYVEVMAGVYLGELAVISIKDEGYGFDYRGMLRNEILRLYVCDVCDLEENGRGMLIVSRLCDRLMFNSQGNKVTILKKIIK